MLAEQLHLTIFTVYTFRCSDIRRELCLRILLNVFSWIIIVDEDNLGSKSSSELFRNFNWIMVPPELMRVLLNKTLNALYRSEGI